MAMVPTRNHPYAAFSEDSHLRRGALPRTNSTMPCSRPQLDELLRAVHRPPVHLPAGQVIHERVLFLSVPNFSDPRATLVYSMVWRVMLASMLDLHHSSVMDRMTRLRQWCLLSHDSHDLYMLSVQRNFVGSSEFLRQE